MPRRVRRNNNSFDAFEAVESSIPIRDEVQWEEVQERIESIMPLEERHPSMFVKKRTSRRKFPNPRSSKEASRNKLSLSPVEGREETRNNSSSNSPGLAYDYNSIRTRDASPPQSESRIEKRRMKIKAMMRKATSQENSTNQHDKPNPPPEKNRMDERMLHPPAEKKRMGERLLNTKRIEKTPHDEAKKGTSHENSLHQHDEPNPPPEKKRMDERVLHPPAEKKRMGERLLNAKRIEKAPRDEAKKEIPQENSMHQHDAMDPRVEEKTMDGSVSNTDKIEKSPRDEPSIQSENVFSPKSKKEILPFDDQTDYRSGPVDLDDITVVMSLQENSISPSCAMHPRTSPYRRTVHIRDQTIVLRKPHRSPAKKIQDGKKNHDRKKNLHGKNSKSSKKSDTEEKNGLLYRMLMLMNEDTSDQAFAKTATSFEKTSISNVSSGEATAMSSDWSEEDDDTKAQSKGYLSCGAWMFNRH